MSGTIYYTERVEHYPNNTVTYYMHQERFPNNTVTYYRREEQYSKAMTKAKKVHDANNTKNFINYLLSFE